MQIIVNADDLGYSQKVNQEILDLMARGYVTSSTLLANAPAIEEAVTAAQQLKNCSFGLHLNATEFRPLTNSTGLAPLLSPNGEMTNIIREIPITPVLREALYAEWCAQVQRIIDLGITPSHFDSHQHVHTIPQLFPVLKRVQRKFGVRKVRISLNIYSRKNPASRLLLLRKVLWNRVLGWNYRTITTSGFTSFEIFWEVVRERRLPYRSIELMVHPGHPGFQAESNLVGQQWWEQLPMKTSRITFHELA